MDGIYQHKVHANLVLLHPMCWLGCLRLLLLFLYIVSVFVTRPYPMQWTGVAADARFEIDLHYCGGGSYSYCWNDDVSTDEQLGAAFVTLFYSTVVDISRQYTSNCILLYYRLKSIFL